MYTVAKRSTPPASRGARKRVVSVTDNGTPSGKRPYKRTPAKKTAQQDDSDQGSYERICKTPAKVATPGSFPSPRTDQNEEHYPDVSTQEMITMGK
jgi:hypothetical protein